MEGSSQSRERMLSGIRAALGHSSEGPAPKDLDPFFTKTPASSGSSLIDHFSEELRRAGGQVAYVQSRNEVGKYIAELQKDDIKASVAVSDGRLIRDLGLRALLQSQGAEIVTTLAEFAGEDRDSKSQYQRVLLECVIGVTAADYALADTGTLVLISGGEQHRLISLLPPVHVCLLSPHLIFPSLTQLLSHAKAGSYSGATPPQALTCITGPSRTADIEQTITLGVHGPQSLHVLIYLPGDDANLQESL
jgi:L-lactate dehydrogenase complex protein LldG